MANRPEPTVKEIVAHLPRPTKAVVTAGMFTKLALSARGEDPEEYAAYWCDPDARVVQFLGQDNVFFYVLMQGALWLGRPG